MIDQFDPGLRVAPDHGKMSFSYGEDVFGPEPEQRDLDSIRKSLLDEDAAGPEIIYAIAMDVGKVAHRAALEERMLLFGVVTYSAGVIGEEPVRSQGHIHAVSKHSGWSPPELYEIWEGEAIIYMQEWVADHPGRCIAVHAGPGDVVLVPPGWAHCTINASTTMPMTFGAWCDREYGFEYDAVRQRHGLAWFPIAGEGGALTWRCNEHYGPSALERKEARAYPQFGMEAGVPIYTQFERDPDRFLFVSRPDRAKTLWQAFEP